MYLIDLVHDKNLEVGGRRLARFFRYSCWLFLLLLHINVWWMTPWQSVC